MAKTGGTGVDLPLTEAEMNIHAALESIGLDSLLSIGIRNWWLRTLGLETTALAIVKAGSIEGFGKLAIADLKKNYDEGPDLSSDVANNTSLVNHVR